MSKDFFDDYDSSFYQGVGSGIGTKFDKTQYVSCYTTHPVLSIGKGKVYGGSCSTPSTDKADIYIGLDPFMKHQTHQYPWEKAKNGGPVEVLFRIEDGRAPSDEKNFVAMIDWLAARLEEGKTLHIGCIGGHGRTGMVLAALVKVVMGEEDAITWVRKNYCHKAVESRVQVKFLNLYFGIKEIEGTKEFEKRFSKKKAQTSSRKFHQDKQGRLPMTVEDFIPGTSILRSKGPRDLVPEIQQRLVRARYLREGNPHSIWNLTNAKKLVKV